MDERRMAPPGESMVEEIRKCRERIGMLLLIYGALIVVAVISGGGNLLFLIVEKGSDTSLAGKILYAALPLFMWYYSQRPTSSGGLLMAYSVIEGAQVAVLLALMVVGSFFMPIESGPDVAFAPLVLLGLFCAAGGILALFVALFRSARRLRNLMESTESAGTAESAGRARSERLDGVMVVLAVVCYLAPAIVPKADMVARSWDISVSEEVKCYALESQIAYMAGSPDGNLLALGTEKGLYVWDTTIRECVWSDDCLSVQRLRFSPSGRYLAASGRGRPEGGTDLVVYEVDGFRRLPGFEWAEHEEHKEKVFHDMMFRPDEETLLVLWHRSWVWNRRGGWHSDEAKSIREREKSLGHKTNQGDLLCTEADVDKGTIGAPRTIRQGLSVSYELSPEGSAYFSPDASRCVYPTNNGRTIAEYKWVHSVDTETWEERVFQLDGYVLRLWRGKRGHFEWKLNADGTKVYLLGKKRENGKDVGVLLELDLETGLEREFPGKGWRLALSTDEKRCVMLAGDNQSKETMLVALNFLDMKTRAEAKVLRKFAREYRGSPRRFVWLKPELFAVAMGEMQGAFIFIDLKEGEGK